MNKVDNVNKNKFTSFFSMQHGHATRKSAYVTGNEELPSLGLSRKQCKLELRTNFISQLVADPWNTLLAEVHRSSLVDDFKMKYDNFHAGLANNWHVKSLH